MSRARSPRAGPPGRDPSPRVVAVGGGHGLSAALRALRRVTDELVAVVGVSDDGGSSGRLRREFGVPPPGDLRMALAALCGDDTWGRTWSRVVQHRFRGDGELAGHAVGNLLITALWEQTGDVVAGLDWVGALLGAHGRVLPVATTGLEIVALVRGDGPGAPVDSGPVEVRGQVAVATAPGVVERVWLEPAEVGATPPALEAIAAADVVVLGPGSWYTSVIAPLLVPGMAPALAASTGRVVVVLNVGQRDAETRGLSPHEHLHELQRHLPGLSIDRVLADPSEVGSRLPELRSACAQAGAELVLAPVAARDGTATHDVDLLASALGGVLLAR